MMGTQTDNKPMTAMVVAEDRIEVIIRETQALAEADKWQARPMNAAEWQHFARVCIETGLNPMLKEIYWIKTKNGAGPYIGRAGLLKIAHQTGTLTGIDSRPLTGEEREAEQIPDGQFAYYAWVFTTTGERGFKALGVAGPGNCFNPDFRSMAIKRAEHAALRKAYSVGIASVEEVDGWDNQFSGQSQPPALPAASKHPLPFGELDAAGKVEELKKAAARTALPAMGKRVKDMNDDELAQFSQRSLGVVNDALLELGSEGVRGWSELEDFDPGELMAVYRIITS